MTRHFLRDDELSPAEQREVLQLALDFEANRYAHKPFAGPQAVALIFDKPTLRTQVSFSTGVAELGGFPLMVDGKLAQIGTRESISDVTNVLSRQVSAIVWRTFEQERIEEMASLSRVPVINALTDSFHPCQILADLAAIAHAKGGVDKLAGLTLAYVGDGANNMAHSYLLGGATAGVNVHIATPEGFDPDPDILAKAQEIAAQTGASIKVTRNLDEAVSGVDVVATDTWVSMGTESEGDARVNVFQSYQVDARVMALAADDALFIHCLPAYRGKEVTAEVIDGDQSIVFLEAEYRLHAQKALMTWLAQGS